ncbi:TetR/AcrR family transcriptional regulator [Kribbella hippodromi]
MRKSADEAQQTRERIVAAGVMQSSVEGLFGLTLGPLAESLGMSKAGVVGPFGNREGLQLEVVRQAADMFTAAVIEPSATTADGLPRLRALIDAWCEYLEASPFPNGCFVTAASCELDGRPGPLRDAMHDVVSRWRGFLREHITIAQAAGDLRGDPDDLVSILNGAAMSANQEIQLLGDHAAAKHARRIMHACIAQLQP